MSRTKTIQLKICVAASQSVTTAELKRRVAARLAGGDEDVEFEKGTLPDPHTKRRGTIFWGVTTVTQIVKR